jgi:hypothetical protein
MGFPPPPASPENAAAKADAQTGAGLPGQPAHGWGESLDKNLKDLNFSNQARQIERLEQRYKEGSMGGAGKPGGAAAGGFK